MTVATIELRGGKANAMNVAMLETIERAIDGFEGSAHRAAVLTGYERFFSAGLALPELIDLDRPAMHAFIGRFSRAMMRVYACNKPLVAAINGHAIAGGCVLALMCDVRVVAGDPGLRIGLNETQLGIGLPAIVVEPLRAAVPPTSLVPIAYAGTLFAPDEARSLGLVDEVATDLAERAHARAAQLAALPPLGLAQVRRQVRAPVLDVIERTAAEATERWLDSWFDPGARERLAAVVAKLRP